MKRTVLLAAVVLGGLGIVTLLPLNADEPANRRPRPEGRESFRGPGRPGMEGGDRSDMRDQVLRRFDEMLNRLERIEQRLGGGSQHERAHAGQGPHSPGHSPGMEQQRGPRPQGPRWMGERGPEGFGPRSADQGPRGPNADRMEGGFARRLDLPEEMRQKMEERMRQGREQMEERMRQGREQMEQAREKMAQAREKFMEMQKRIEKLEAEVKQMKESLKPNAEVKEPAEAK